MDDENLCIELTNSMFDGLEANPDYEYDAVQVIAIVTTEDYLGIRTRISHPMEAVKILLKAAETIVTEQGGELHVMPVGDFASADQADSLSAMLKAALIRRHLEDC